MNEITIKARGKINLLLDVTGKRENGYHDITTIMQSVNLYDMVTVRKTDDKALILKTDFDALVAPQDNIAYKAMQLMQDKYDTDCGFSAEIQKNIPMAGGMGAAVPMLRL